jgi:hypothetical protein
VLTLARQWLRRDAFPDLAQPVLDRLAQKFGVTMLGVQILGSTGSSPSPSRRRDVPGQRPGRQPLPRADQRHRPLHRRFRQTIPMPARSALQPLRWDDPPSFAEWQEQVAQTRAQGFGIDEGHYIAGVPYSRAGVESHRREGRATRSSPSASAARSSAMACLNSRKRCWPRRRRYPPSWG